MVKVLSAFPLSARLMMIGFLQRFKKDERGLSGVVVAILLILIAVLAIVLIWGFLSGWLAEIWERIIGQTGSIN